MVIVLYILRKNFFTIAMGNGARFPFTGQIRYYPALLGEEEDCEKQYQYELSHIGKQYENLVVPQFEISIPQRPGGIRRIVKLIHY